MFFSRATTRRSLMCFVIIFDSCQALARCLSRSERATFALIVSFTRARRAACKIEMSALSKDVPWVLNARNTSCPSCACSLFLTLRKEVANCNRGIRPRDCSAIINNVTAMIGLELHSALRIDTGLRKRLSHAGRSASAQMRRRRRVAFAAWPRTWTSIIPRGPSMTIIVDYFLSRGEPSEEPSRADFSAEMRRNDKDIGMREMLRRAPGDRSPEARPRRRSSAELRNFIGGFSRKEDGKTDLSRLSFPSIRPRGFLHKVKDKGGERKVLLSRCIEKTATAILEVIRSGNVTAGPIAR